MSKKTKGLIVGIIVVSILAAVGIHLAFIPQTSNPWIYAKWTGGEILTYIGTIALGIIAIGQNGQMEDISRDANRMNVLSKAIEYEMTKKAKMESLLLNLQNELNVQRIVTVVFGEEKKEKNNKKDLIVMGIQISIQSSAEAVICEIDDDEIDESQELVAAIDDCRNAAKILLEKMLDHEINDCEAEIMMLMKNVSVFSSKKDNYCKVKQDELDQFIYTDMIDMKKIY